MDQKTHEYRLSQWEPIITECKNSGLPVATWCRENNVDKQKFYYWQRRLRAAVFGETTTDAPNFKPPAVPNKKKTTIVELPTPIMYKYSGAKLNNFDHPEIWKHTSISNIIKNRVYVI